MLLIKNICDELASNVIHSFNNTIYNHLSSGNSLPFPPQQILQTNTLQLAIFFIMITLTMAISIWFLNLWSLPQKQLYPIFLITDNFSSYNPLKGCVCSVCTMCAVCVCVGAQRVQWVKVSRFWWHYLLYNLQKLEQQQSPCSIWTNFHWFVLKASDIE